MSKYTTCENFDTIRSTLDLLVNQLNSLSVQYADAHPNLTQDTYASSRCHPLLLQTLKPIETTGDGHCMYNALSLTSTGTEDFTHVIRLLRAYALVKYKHVMISTLRASVNTLVYICSCRACE